MELHDTVEYKGKEIRIYVDPEPTNPREWDNLGKMVCWHRGYNLGDERHGKDFSCSPEEYLEGLASVSSKYQEAKERFEDIESRLTGWHWSEGDKEMVPREHISLWVRAQAFVARLKNEALDEYVILPLYLYDHSGITMRTKPFSCKWDSGQVGFIYCDLDMAKKNFMLPDDSTWDTKLNDSYWNGRTLKDVVADMLNGEVETYDQYLRGDIYGWETDTDSCWGYFGTDFENNGLLEDAKASIGCE